MVLNIDEILTHKEKVLRANRLSFLFPDFVHAQRKNKKK